MSITMKSIELGIFQGPQIRGLFMDSRLVRIFCANLTSQKARGSSYNFLLLLKKDCLFCHRSECYGPPSPSISLESIKSLAELFKEKLAGIQLLAWQRFLSIFTENISSDEIDKALERIARNSASSVPDVKTASELAKKFREITALIEKSYLSRNK